MIRLVRQDDACGCAVACLAMVTGQSYAAVKAAWPADTYDFTARGITYDDVQQYLGDRLIPNIRRFRFLLGRNWVGRQERRPDWPAPFAPVHIIGINSGGHDVVLLRNGVVFDPMCDGPRRLEDVGEVSFMVGVWPGVHLELP